MASGTPLREHRSVSPASWSLALLGPVAVSVALIPVRTDIRASNVSLVLVVVVILAAIAAGRVGGAVAACSSAIAFDFFFTRPYYSLRIAGRDDVETAILLLVVGLIVGELVVRSWQSRAAAASSRHEVERVRRVSAVAAGGESPGALILRVRQELVDVLHAQRCRFESPPFLESYPVLAHGSVRLPGVELPARGPESSNLVALPVFGRGREIGRFVVELEQPGSGVLIPVEDRALASALADQLGAALVEINQSS